MKNQTVPDGLFIFPYNPHDWAVIVVFFAAYCTRMYLMRQNPDTRNPKTEDYVGILFLSLLVCVPSYEVAIKRKMEIEYFLPILGVEILIAKDILDYILLSPEGRQFVISTFKEMLTGFIGRLGYVKKE